MSSTTSSASTLAVSATTSTSSATTSSNHISYSISSPNTLQQFIPLTSDDHYITGTSQDGKLRLRMDKATLQQLTALEVDDLYRNPVAFLMNTEFPLLQVYKRIETIQNSSTDVYYNNTQATGYCQPAMLEQLHRRHQSGNNITPDKLDLNLHADRVRLIVFINTLIRSLGPDNPETLRYQDVITQLSNGNPSLNSTLWMGLECIHVYQFSFPVTGWVHNQQDDNYISLAYTNRLGVSQRHLGNHPLSCSDIQIISKCTNDFHHTKSHFYIVPSTNEKWSVIQDRLRSALVTMVPGIQAHLLPFISEEIHHHRNRIQSQLEPSTATSDTMQLSSHSSTYTQQELIPGEVVNFLVNAVDVNVNSTSSESNSAQSIHPSADDHAITGTSKDGKLRIRIEKTSLINLGKDIVDSLYRDPVPFLMTTDLSLLHIYKQVINDPLSGLDIHFNNTQATGYCLPAMLEQLHRRDQRRSRMCHDHLYSARTGNGQLDLRNSLDRVRFKLFIDTLITSTSLTNPDVPRYQAIITQLNTPKSLPDMSVGMSLEHFHEYQFKFPVTGWVRNTYDNNFAALAYTNRLGTQHQNIGNHPICCAHIRTLSKCTNDFHHSNNHFYIVPSINEDWSIIQDRIRSALIEMVSQIQELLRPLVTMETRHYMKRNEWHPAPSTVISSTTQNSSSTTFFQHHVTLGDDWARMKLHERTIQNMTNEELQKSFSNPRQYLRTCNITMFQIQFSTTYDQIDQPPTYSSNLTDALNYDSLVTCLHNHCSTSEMVQLVDIYLYAAIDSLAAVLLKLIPRLTIKYVAGEHHFSTQLPEVSARSTNNTIILCVSNDYYHHFTSATSREEIYHILFHQSVPTIALFKKSNTTLRPHVSLDTSHSCFKTLILSQERDEPICNNLPYTIPDYLKTSIKGSPDHVRYVNWLKTQSRQILFEYNIKHRLSRAIDTAHIQLRSRDIPDTDELVQLNIKWRTTIWCTHGNPESQKTYPAWSNRLSQHFRLPQSRHNSPVLTNAFNFQQILTLLRGNNDIESCGKLYYPLPSPSDDKLVLQESASALWNLAGNLYDILTSIYNPTRIILPSDDSLSGTDETQPPTDLLFTLNEQVWYIKPNHAPKLVVITAIHKEEPYPDYYTIRPLDMSNEIQTVVNRLSRQQPLLDLDQPGMETTNHDTGPTNTSSSVSTKPLKQTLITSVIMPKPVYDTMELEAIIQTSKFFPTVQTRNILIRELNVGIILTPTMYPSMALRNELGYLLHRTEIRKATYCDGMGLFTVPRISKGEVIIIYGGKPITNGVRNAYTMQINNDYEVGHSPLETDMWTKGGYINDYIWNHKQCNCKMLSNGVIVATKDIKGDSELFMSYGQHYDWSAVKLSYHILLVDAIILMSTMFPPEIIVPSEARIRHTYNVLLQNSGFILLLDQFFFGTARQPERTLSTRLHNDAPTYTNDNVERWIEMLLCCRWFYEQQCFRRFLNPNIYIKTQPFTIIPIVPLARSTRKRTIIDYKELDSESSDEDKVSMHRLHYPPLNLFEARYINEQGQHNSQNSQGSNASDNNNINANSINSHTSYDSNSENNKLSNNSNTTGNNSHYNSTIDDNNSDSNTGYLCSNNDTQCTRNSRNNNKRSFNSDADSDSASENNKSLNNNNQKITRSDNNSDINNGCQHDSNRVSNSSGSKTTTNNYNESSTKEANGLTDIHGNDTCSIMYQPNESHSLPTHILQHISDFLNDDTYDDPLETELSRQFTTPLQSTQSHLSGSHSPTSTTALDDDSVKGNNDTSSSDAPSPPTEYKVLSEDLLKGSLDKLADSLCKPKYRHYPTPSSLSVMYFNIGTNGEIKRKAIYDLISYQHLDITFITDIQISASGQASFLSHARRNLAKGYTVLLFPTQTGQLSNATIGGTAVIVSKRIQDCKAISLVALGTLIQLNCRFGTQRLSLFSLYNPRNNDSDGSLQSRLSAELKIDRNHVHSHIHTTLRTAVRAAQIQSIPVIVSADFNSNISDPITSPVNLRYLFNDLRLQHAATPLELTQDSYQQGIVDTSSFRSTRIDYTLYQDDYDILHPTKCTCHEYDTYRNDHLPIITLFTLPGLSQPHQPLMTKGTQPRYNRKDPQMKTAFELAASSLSTYIDANPVDRLEFITRDTIELVLQLNPKRKGHRGRLINDWCPENLALEQHRINLIRLRRHLSGQKGYLKWTANNYTSKLIALCKQWKTNVRCLGVTRQLRDSYENLTTYGPRFWEDMLYDDLLVHIHVAIKEVHVLSRNKIRLQRRLDFEQYTMKREFAFQIQQIGAPIQSILKNHRQVYPMEDILFEGERISSPGRLTEILRNNFDTWFQSQPGAAEQNWPDALQSEAAFMAMTATQHIPEGEASLLWLAISKRPTPSQRLSIFQQEIMRMPTYPEYIEQVNIASVDSSGGMSGLTYGMMKSWPEHIHKTVYESLATMWTSKDKIIPPSWQWRWLLPIPKEADPTPDQLRPLCLLEVLRKLWSKIFIHRITKFIQQEQLLHSGQHSGKGKGTESAVLEFATALETAKELKSEIYISSWDIRRAFDSVDRRLLLFAWVRIGIPKELAQYLVDMDKEAMMVVQTPLAVAVHNEYGPMGLAQTGIAFHPQQGTAQGGVDSSLIFSAFLDILLCAIALGSTPESTFYISDIDGNLQASEPIAYVDDLVCVQGSAAGLQKVADIVSAFCQIFFLELNTSKFRAFAVYWGNDKRPVMTQMKIHTSNWTPSIVTMQCDGTMKHLGVLWDMSLHNVHMLNLVYEQLDLCLENVIHSKASLGIKLTAVRVTIMNQLIYQTKFSTWSTEEYERLDIPFNKAYRRITKNLDSFPTKLLYLSTNEGGLGLPRFSYLVQQAKLSMFQRSMYGTNLRRQFIMNSLTGRVLRQMGCQPCRYGPYALTMINLKHFPVSERHSWWFSSLATHLTSLNITIERNTVTDPPLPIHLSSEFRLTYNDNTILSSCGITSPLELYMVGDDMSTLTRLELSKLSHFAPVDIQPVPIRQGQVWLRQQLSTNTNEMIEIAGFYRDHNISYYPWQVTNTRNNMPTHVSLYGGSSVMLGAGSKYMINTDVFFVLNNIDYEYYLVTLSGEKYTATSNTATCNGLRRRTPLGQHIVHNNQQLDWFNDITSELSVHTITHRPTQTILQKLQQQNHINARTIIVKTDQHDVRHALIINHDCLLHDNITSACVFSLHVASSQCTNPRQTYIATSKIGISLHRKSTDKPVADILSPLLQPTKAARMFAMPSPSEAQASQLAKLIKRPDLLVDLPGNQQDHSFLTKVFMNRADNLTVPQIEMLYPHSTVTHISAQNCLDRLCTNINGILCDTTTHQPILTSVESRYQKLLRQDYYSKRDIYRQDVFNKLYIMGPHMPYWKNTSMRLAGDLFSRVPRDALRASLNRLTLDKHQTGRNKLKQTLNPADAVCLLCHDALEDQQHIMCDCKHPHMIATRLHHKQLIQKQTATFTTDSNQAKFIRKLDNILQDRENHELILGRVHQHHVRSLATLPRPTSDGHLTSLYNDMLKHIKLYTIMTIGLYQTRQTILDQLSSDPALIGIDTTIPDFDIERQRVLISESLIGIAANHYLHIDGTKVVKQIDESTTNIILSRNRLQLTPANSVILRREQQAADSIQAKQNKLENIQRALQDELAFQRIDADERVAYRDLHYPDEIPLTTAPSTTTTPVLVDDSTREQREQYHNEQQSARLSYYLKSVADLEPSLAFPVIPHTETSVQPTEDNIVHDASVNDNTNELQNDTTKSNPKRSISITANTRSSSKRPTKETSAPNQTQSKVNDNIGYNNHQFPHHNLDVSNNITSNNNKHHLDKNQNSNNTYELILNSYSNNNDNNNNNNGTQTNVVSNNNINNTDIRNAGTNNSQSNNYNTPHNNNNNNTDNNSNNNLTHKLKESTSTLQSGKQKLAIQDRTPKTNKKHKKGILTEYFIQNQQINDTVVVDNQNTNQQRGNNNNDQEYNHNLNSSNNSINNQSVNNTDDNNKITSNTQNNDNHNNSASDVKDNTQSSQTNNSNNTNNNDTNNNTDISNVVTDQPGTNNYNNTHNNNDNNTDNNSNNNLAQKIKERTLTLQSGKRNSAIQYGIPTTNKKHKKETITEYFCQQSNTNEKANHSKVKINANNNVVNNNQIKNKNKQNGNNNSNQECKNNVDNNNDITCDTNRNIQFCNNNNNNNNDNNNNSNNNNNNNCSSLSNIINNNSLSSSTDHQILARNTNHKKKTVKSHKKLISKHAQTSSKNNMLIEYYFQPTPIHTLDNTIMSSNSNSTSVNGNSSPAKTNCPPNLNPPPSITVTRHQTDSALPAQSQQLQPLPDVVVSRKRPRTPDPPPSSPILANKRRPIGHCSPGTAEGPSGQG